MFQLDVLAVAHIQEMRREAEETLQAAALREQAPGAGQRLAATTLLWAGERLSRWGDQLQNDYERHRMSSEMASGAASK